jgi:uncharacterized protein
MVNNPSTGLRFVGKSHGTLTKADSSSLVNRGLADVVLFENAEKLFETAQRFFAQGDLKASFDYLLRATAKNPLLSEAQFWLGWAYYLGWRNEGPSGDPDSASDAFLAGAQLGHAPSQNNLGVLLEEVGVWNNADEWEQPRLAEAEHWFRQAAEQGLAIAQYNLGRLYEDSAFRERMDQNPAALQDNSKAEPWYRKAAEQGFIEAQYALGRLLADAAWETVRMSKSPKQLRATEEARKPLYLEAAKWFHMAALQKHSEAQCELGRILEKGYVCMIKGKLEQMPSKFFPDNLPMSRFREANRWYRLAAEQGNRSAQHALAVNLAIGWGAKKNTAEAIHWFHEALRRGYGMTTGTIMRFAETPEFEAQYPNLRSYEEKYTAIKAIHAGALESLELEGTENSRKERICTRMCGLPRAG